VSSALFSKSSEAPSPQRNLAATLGELFDDSSYGQFQESLSVDNFGLSQNQPDQPDQSVQAVSRNSGQAKDTVFDGLFFDPLENEPGLPLVMDFEIPRSPNDALIEAMANNNNDNNNNNSHITVYDTPKPLVVAQMEKRRIDPQTYLNIQVSMGQMSTYPQMLVQERLPPFIFPACVLQNRLPSVCAKDGIHRCLPRPLAVCASLVAMFRARSSLSSSYIWTTIYRELKALHTEVSKAFHPRSYPCFTPFALEIPRGDLG
jgi:hypothetical protein